MYKANKGCCCCCCCCCRSFLWPLESLNPPYGPLTMVIPLKLVLDIALSSSADITRVLRGFFR